MSNIQSKVARLSTEERRLFKDREKRLNIGFILTSLLEYLKTHEFVNKNNLALYIVKEKMNIPICSTISLFEHHVRIKGARGLYLLLKAGGLVKWGRSNYRRVEEVLKELTVKKIIETNNDNK